MNEDTTTVLREELVRLALKKEIGYTEKFIKKASQECLEKIKQEYDLSLREVANTQLTEIFIGKFSELMKHLDVVKDNDTLSNELSENKLFCRDVKSLVEKITPFIPLIGLLTGGLILAKLAWTERNKTENKDVVQNNDEAGSSNSVGATVNSNNDRADTA